MRKRLLDTVKVYSLNREEIINKLTSLAQRLLEENKNVLRVILFGSLASKGHSPRSDIDLLVVLSDDNRRRMDRIPEFLRYFLEVGHPVDVLVYTAKEIEDEKEESFLKRVLGQGVLLAVRSEG